MSISPQEIISTVQTFPPAVQEEIVRTLEKNLRQSGFASASPSEDEIEKRLLAKGLISEIPKRTADSEEETYTAIKIKGEPLSETILKERE